MCHADPSHGQPRNIGGRTAEGIAGEAGSAASDIGRIVRGLASWTAGRIIAGMSNEFRTEKDSMGEMKVPAGAYYGASTARAGENFPIPDLRFSRRYIAAMGLIKWAAAEVNEKLGLFDA